jgi:ribonuclease T2
MENYWVDIHGRNEQFWEHEWGKHGTCLSTLNPSCLPDGSPEGAEAVAFFRTVVGLFPQYNIYQSLAANGINPTTERTYTLSELESALQSSFGVEATFDCNHGRNLNQVYIYFNLRGSVIDGAFTPIDAPKRGNCPSHGIRYEPKN